MLPTRGYATKSPSSPLEPFDFERRDPGPHDVLIDILYSGICHSDIHQARDEWGGSVYPMVPGHEIVGRVAQVGPEVTGFRVGDLAGVGCFVDSCRVCENCTAGLEQYCDNHISFTYNSTGQDRKTPTYGGYSSRIVVDEQYTLKVSPRIALPNVAPLLCAGITMYSPIKRFLTGGRQQVGVVGLGGLGHIAVKLAASMGGDVTVFSTSRSKAEDAHRLGAKNFVSTRNGPEFAGMPKTFDLILDTVSAEHDLNMYLNLLRRDGVLVLVGAPPKPLAVQAFSLLMKRRHLLGSIIGGIRETQEMLDYCTEKNITSDVEIIRMEQVNEAYERMLRGDVRYRFVIDVNKPSS